jgi:hypothetical protein
MGTFERYLSVWVSLCIAAARLLQLPHNVAAPGG